MTAYVLGKTERLSAFLSASHLNCVTTAVTLKALLDTGADGTLIPLTYLREILAPPLTETRLRSHWGEWRIAQLFLVEIQIGISRMPNVFVVGDEQDDEIVLGRNVLNRLNILGSPVFFRVSTFAQFLMLTIETILWVVEPFLVVFRPLLSHYVSFLRNIKLHITQNPTRYGRTVFC